MSALKNEDLSRFTIQAQSWRSLFAARIRVAVALREEGRWSLWYSYTVFLPEVVGTVETFTLETQTVRACRELVLLENEEAAERAIAEVLDDPNSLSTASWQAELAPSTGHLSFVYEPLHPDRLAGPKRLPAITASWSNPNYRTFQKSKELDQELQLSDTPFDGFADLALALNVPIGFDELNKRRLSEVVLIPPSEVLWDTNVEPHSDLKSGLLSLVIKSHQLVQNAQLRIGIKAFPQRGVPERFTLPSTAISRDADGFLRGAAQLRQDTAVVQVFLSIGGDFLGKWWIRDFGNSFNDRMLLHRALDAGDQFRKSFFEKPEQFEDKVHLLLTLIGFTALKYGKIQTDAPDILAISSARHVFVVECTTGDINSKGKLQRLSDRTRQIRETLENSSNPPIGAVPVVFTSLKREETAMHWETAATFRIAIVARENIAGLLEVLDAAIQMDQLYAATLALIPSKKAEPNQQPAGA